MRKYIYRNKQQANCSHEVDSLSDRHDSDTNQFGTSQEVEKHKRRQREKRPASQSDQRKRRTGKRKVLEAYQMQDRRDQLERMDRNALRAIEYHHKESMDRIERSYKRQDYMNMFNNSD